MAETLTIRTASSTDVVKIAVPGPQGPAGQGVPVGGTTGQVLRKASGSDYDTEWAAAGSGSGSVTSVSLASTDLTISGSPITSSGTITANIAANAVTLEKLQTISSEHLLGRHGSGNGGVQTIGLGTGLAMSESNVRVATTGITAGTYTKLTIDETGRATVGATAAPSDIGASPALVVNQFQTLQNDITLTSARYVQHRYSSYLSTDVNITLPTSQIENGDTVIISGSAFSTGKILIRKQNEGSPPFTVLAEIAGLNNKYTFRSFGTNSDWDLLPVDTHTHAASAITSGTLDIARIPTGTSSTQVALGDHTHSDLHTRSHAITSTSDHTAGNHKVFYSNGSGEIVELALGNSGEVLTSNGATSAPSFAAASGSGVTGAAASASDVLGVSGSDITGVDATADRIVFWDDSASKLAYLEAGSGLSLSGTTLSATGGGVTTGSVDNAILRADGTGGSTSQSSDIVIDDATTSTQANVALVNNHSETNSALVLTPKGTGAFIVGPKPDGTSTGGNARGARAIDISLSRGTTTRVASGDDAILIGNQSTASTADAIAIGRNVNSSGTFTTAVGYASSATNTRSTAYGNSAVCTGSLAVALGPEITVNATEAIGIGWGAIASATRAVCVASDNTANLRAGFFTWPFRAVYWGGQTTNDTPLILNLDATATSRFTIAASTALAVDILLVARRSNTQDKWLVARRFLGIRRDGSNNTSLIGSVQTIGTDQSDGSPSWTFALTADDTNEALQLEVTGAASETVQWRATAFYRVA